MKTDKELLKASLPAIDRKSSEEAASVAAEIEARLKGPRFFVVFGCLPEELDDTYYVVAAKNQDEARETFVEAIYKDSLKGLPDDWRKKEPVNGQKAWAFTTGMIEISGPPMNGYYWLPGGRRSIDPENAVPSLEEIYWKAQKVLREKSTGLARDCARDGNPFNLLFKVFRDEAEKLVEGLVRCTAPAHMGGLFWITLFHKREGQEPEKGCFSFEMDKELENVSLFYYREQDGYLKPARLLKTQTVRDVLNLLE